MAVQLKELSELVLDFDIEAIGFELPEIDFRIQSLDDPDAIDNADEFEPRLGRPCPSPAIYGCSALTVLLRKRAGDDRVRRPRWRPKRPPRCSPTRPTT